MVLYLPITNNNDLKNNKSQVEEEPSKADENYSHNAHTERQVTAIS